MPGQELLHQATLDIAGRTPANPAWYSAKGTKHTYGDLCAAAGMTARYLRENGVGPGDTVGLFLERGPDMATAILGVLSAGAAYLPIGLEEPSIRQQRIVSRCHPRLVIAHAASRPRLTITATDLGTMTRRPAQCDRLAGSGASPAGPHDAAYVVFTSGSSGVPKGVVVEHRNLIGHIDWLRVNLPLGPGDRLLQVAPYTFDASVTDFFWPLSCGAAVVSLDEGAHRDPLLLARTIVRQRITAVRLPPAILPLLLREPELSGATGLRYLICGGDRLTAGLARRIAQVLPRVRLFNRYGPTETAVAVTYHEVTPADLDDGAGDVPLGEPVGGALLRILDGDGQLWPPTPGRAGELLIGGAPVARGYLGDDALTASRFQHMAGIGRVFRTGDWVRVTGRGDILFTGRRDDQVQVAGHRVELGEVTATLRGHPAVDDCVVVLEEGGAALAAYVTVRGREPGKTELRAFLRARLPGYMVPRQVTFLDRLPVTDRGKVDLSALASGGQRAAARPAGAEPHARRLWRELLGTAEPAAGFIASGGTSLQAALLASRLRSELGATVTVSDIIVQPTLRAFEEWVVSLRPAAGRPSRHRRPAGTAAPLSYLQERLWFMHQYAPEGLAYNFQAICHFTGDLDESALRATLAGIIQRHEILRTTFPSRSSIPRQQIHPAAGPSLTEVDLPGAGVCPRRAGAAARALAGEFIRTPFDIGTLPLIRWCLIRLDDQRQWLVHSQHHLTHDGWSFMVFLREFLDRYRSEISRTPVRLAPRYLQCGDFAQAERQWWDRDGARTHLPYWLEQLRGVPRLALPGRPDAVSGPAGTQVRRRIPADQVLAIKDVSAGLGLTPFMFCFAAWVAFVWTLTGQPDFAVGTAFANRAEPEAEHMLGSVLSNIAIRARPGPELEFAVLAGQMRQRLLDGYAHGGAPLQAVVQALGPRRTPENPLFQTAFSFMDVPFPDLALPGVRMELEEAIPNGTSKLPIGVVVITAAQRRTGGTEPDEWDFVCTMSTRHFAEGQAAAIADVFRGLLTQVIADPGLRLADLKSLAGLTSPARLTSLSVEDIR